MHEQETCARCGHTSGGCTRCGQRHAFLGGRIDDRRFCHTFAEGPETCYTMELRTVPIHKVGRRR